MACRADLVQYIVEQCSGAGEITAKKMFGEYGIYCNGKLFGLICDDQLFMKITEAGKQRMPHLETAPPYEGAKAHFVVSDLDDSDALSAFVRATCDALPPPKSNRKRGTRHGI